MPTTTHRDSDTSTPPECVGPMAISPALARALRSLADAATVDDVVPLSVCATELLRRLSRPGARTWAHVICGPREAVAPLSTECWDPGLSFRAALSRYARRRMSTVRVDLTILVSPDHDRLYVERMTDSADLPTAQHCADSFLHLLASLTAEPDAPLAAHTLPEEGGAGD
ncbi:hypothetical protein [Phytohabitans kaempferiae]|uniref:Condensation domain-containing protein n=1 Tax=Phytohabitans kaempferiae TaxID=1620943 RepID=A0ABV6LZE5_9ACTN